MAKIIAKDWYKSKTIWFNLVSAIVIMAGALQAFPLPEWLLEVMAFIVTGGNMLLRFSTSQGIK